MQKKVLILGLGSSAMSCLKLMVKRNFFVHVYDDHLKKPDLEKKIKKNINPYYLKKIKVINPKNYQSICLMDSVLVPSAGIKPDHPLIEIAQNIKSCRVFSEAEFGISLLDKNYIAVTGTNGKSTVCTIISKIFAKFFLNMKVIGNIGRPICEEIYYESSQVDNDNVNQKNKHKDHNKKNNIGYIIELSSFQLYQINYMNPLVSVITNIANDHLDYHKNFKNYALAKLKLIEFNNYLRYPKNQLIINYDVLQLIKKYQLNIANFDLELTNPKKPYNQAFNHHKDYQDKNIIIAIMAAKGFANKLLKHAGCFNDPLNKKNHFCENNQSNLKKLINTSNAALIDMIKADKIQLDHRLQDFFNLKAKNQKVIKFVDDSKATNLKAVCYALNVYKNYNIILVLAGRIKKNQDFTILTKYFKPVTKVFVFGAMSEFIKNNIAIISKEFTKKHRDFFWIDSYGSFLEFVCSNGEFVKYIKYQARSSKAIKDSVVLFSPGGDSFDEFNDFAARGKAFKKSINKLFI